MKKIGIIFLLLLILIASVACSAKDKVQEIEDQDYGRFVPTGQSFALRIGEKGALIDRTYVIEDTETHVLYLYSMGTGTSFLTPWLDAEGKPMKKE